MSNINWKCIWHVIHYLSKCFHYLPLLKIQPNNLWINLECNYVNNFWSAYSSFYGNSTIVHLASAVADPKFNDISSCSSITSSALDQWLSPSTARAFDRGYSESQVHMLLYYLLLIYLHIWNQSGVWLLKSSMQLD